MSRKLLKDLPEKNLERPSFMMKRLFQERVAKSTYHSHRFPDHLIKNDKQ